MQYPTRNLGSDNRLYNQRYPISNLGIDGLSFGDLTIYCRSIGYDVPFNVQPCEHFDGEVNHFEGCGYGHIFAHGNCKREVSTWSEDKVDQVEDYVEHYYRNVLRFYVNRYYRRRRAQQASREWSDDDDDEHDRPIQLNEDQFPPIGNNDSVRTRSPIVGMNYAESVRNAFGVSPIPSEISEEQAVLAEINEAAADENNNQDTVPAEINEAAASENNNQDTVPAEINEAAAAENHNQDTVPAEINEAAADENNNQDTVPAEINEAAAAENHNQDTVPAEINEAAAAENHNQDTVPAEISEQPDLQLISHFYNNEELGLSKAHIVGDGTLVLKYEDNTKSFGFTNQIHCDHNQHIRFGYSKPIQFGYVMQVGDNIDTCIPTSIQLPAITGKFFVGAMLGITQDGQVQPVHFSHVSNRGMTIVVSPTRFKWIHIVKQDDPFCMKMPTI
jgi:hypothetical protein